MTTAKSIGRGAVTRLSGRPARRGVVVIAGPDGSGKSSLVRALAQSGLGSSVLTLHHRPGLLPTRSSGSSTDPRANAPYGRVVSILKVLYVWLDYRIGWALRVKPFARGGWVILERGWSDLLVDPLRYRLSGGARTTRFLGRFLPAADRTLFLEVPAPQLASRKDELPVAELDRQNRAWGEIAQRDRSVVCLDATLEPEELRCAALAAIDDVGVEVREWVSLPSRQSPRWILPRSPRRVAGSALRIYQPVTLRGLIAWLVARAFASLGGFRLLPRGAGPPGHVMDALSEHMSPDGVAALARTADPGTWIAMLMEPDGALREVGSVATTPDGRKRLARKAAASNLPELPHPLHAPRVLARSDGVLLFEPVLWRLRALPWRVPLDVARSLGVYFRQHSSDGRNGPSHGDLAPWNLLRSRRGWALLDWEESSPDSGSAFHDLFHYLVQSSALLRRPSRHTLLAGVRGKGWVGKALRAYARAAKIPFSEVDASFVLYLQQSIPRVDLSRPEGEREVRTRERLLAAMTSSARDHGGGA